MKIFSAQDPHQVSSPKNVSVLIHITFGNMTRAVNAKNNIITIFQYVIGKCLGVVRILREHIRNLTLRTECQITRLASAFTGVFQSEELIEQ